MWRILGATVAGALALSASSAVYWIGLAAAVGTHGVQWSQFHLPGAYSAHLVASVAISWALAGLAIAAILPRRA